MASSTAGGLLDLTFVQGEHSASPTLLSLLLLLPRRLFHRCNYYLVAAIYGYLLALADWWGGSRFTIYCTDEFYEKLDKRKVGERQLVVANHHTELDWLFCWQLADRGGLLGGCRALVKKCPPGRRTRLTWPPRWQPWRRSQTQRGSSSS